MGLGLCSLVSVVFPFGVMLSWGCPRQRLAVTLLFIFLQAPALVLYLKVRVLLSSGREQWTADATSQASAFANFNYCLQERIKCTSNWGTFTYVKISSKEVVIFWVYVNAKRRWSIERWNELCLFLKEITRAVPFWKEWMQNITEGMWVYSQFLMPSWRCMALVSQRRSAVYI